MNSSCFSLFLFPSNSPPMEASTVDNRSGIWQSVNLCKMGCKINLSSQIVDGVPAAEHLQSFQQWLHEIPIKTFSAPWKCINIQLKHDLLFCK